MRKVAVLGEVMIEFAPEGGGLYRLGVAGDTYNSACTLAGLGLEVSYVTSLGGGRAADVIRNHAKGRGVQLREPAGDEARTPGLYTITNDDTGERYFDYWRDTSAARALLQDAERLAATLERVAKSDAFFFSGITLALMGEEARAVLAAYLDAYRSLGGKVVFDPNHRPRLWGANDREKAAAAISALMPLVDLYLPGRDEEAALFGCEGMAAVLARLGAAAPGTIVLKNAGGDCEVRHEGKNLVIPMTPASAIVDATGAGDTFNGAFLAAMLAEVPVKGAVEFAAEAASAVLGVRGGVLPPERLDALRMRLDSRI